MTNVETDKTYAQMALDVLCRNPQGFFYPDMYKRVQADDRDWVRRHMREPRPNRTGTRAWSLFGAQALYDVCLEFPLLQSKSVHTKSVVGELLWMLSGSTNVRDLQARGVTIWDEWADDAGSLGPIYGQQWRNWQGTPRRDDMYPRVDQIASLIQGLRERPYDRGHVVSVWNAGDLKSMALRPCHCMFQCYIEPDPADAMRPWLDLQLYQRSADLFLGVPFNMASYALLQHMIAAQVKAKPRRLIHTFGDLHIYENHLDQVLLQLRRIKDLSRIQPASLILDSAPSIDDYTAEHVLFRNYEPDPAIPAEVAV